MPFGHPPADNALKTCAGDHASHPQPGPGAGRDGKNAAAVLIARDDPASASAVAAYSAAVSRSTARCMSAALGRVYSRVVSSEAWPISSATVTMSTPRRVSSGAGRVPLQNRRRYCDLRFGRMSWLRQDRGLCLFACFT